MNRTVITKRPMPAANHVHDDPRYVAAAKRYSEVLKERDALKQEYEEARAAENRSQAGDDAVARYLTGEPAPEVQPSAKVWSDLRIREAALVRQREEMNRLAQQISGEICAAEKLRHDALAKRLATALREAKEADQALSTFTAELMRRSVQPTYPVLVFVPARESGAFNSIDGWQARYAEYLG